jgi:lipoprotein-anchoring transpeptidase ErfK/SrfK
MGSFRMSNLNKHKIHFTERFKCPHVLLFHTLLTLLATLMIVGSGSVYSVADADDTGVFRWTDEHGTVVFTDDPMNLPPKSGKPAKKKAAARVEARQAQKDGDHSTGATAKQEITLHGGRNGRGADTPAERAHVTVSQESRPERRKTVHEREEAGTESVGMAADGGALNQGQSKDNYYIKVSIGQCRLTLFKKGDKTPMVPIRTYRVGTVAKGLGVYPIGKGKITRIDLSPYWYPTEHTRKIYEGKGIELPKAVPPGHPLNYMGTFKIHLSHATSQGSIYRIHGNNNKRRIGKRVTGGCICMDNAEGMELAKIVPVGTEVAIGL